jgi:hypothetical protein
MTACPLDGSNRIVVESDRYSTIWKCPFCGQLSREEFEPDPANDVQRSFDR